MMDNSATAFHTAKTKKQPMQRVKNDQTGPVQTRVDATRANKMALMFFHTKASSTQTLYPGGKLSRSVQQGALARFMRKRTTLVSAQGQRPGWYAASVHENWLLKRQEDNPPCLTPVDLFLFWRVEWELAGLSLSQDSLKKSWEGAVSTIAKDECARAFRWWMKLFKNLVRSSGDYDKKITRH